MDRECCSAALCEMINLRTPYTVHWGVHWEGICGDLFCNFIHLNLENDNGTKYFSTRIEGLIIGLNWYNFFFNFYLASDIDDLNEQLNGERRQVQQVCSELCYTPKNVPRMPVQFAAQHFAPDRQSFLSLMWV